MATHYSDSGPSQSRSLERSIIRVAAIVTAALSIPVLAFGFLYLAGTYMDFLAPTTVDSAYANRDEAEADNLFGRGWMPRDMPATMDELRIRTDVDINFAWATFSTDAAGIDTIRDRYRSVSGSAAVPPGRPRVTWWPDDLKSGRHLQNTNLEVYACGNRDKFIEAAFLALDPKTHQVYYWLK